MERLFHDLAEVLKRRETVLVFTQYTDTMDYLRERLRPVYGRQLACYSGRGGERWDGTLWKEVSKEEIKTAFKKGEDIKILLCTEAASEGLNLQTCGVLINYDMPWNPMRVEQRIGRIDRIGQVHSEVWIKNYFYEDTVEALVYQRLEDRIDWFQEVVGELQPILSRIEEVIRKAALSGKEARERILEEELTRLREDIETRKVEALNLDELAAFQKVSAGLPATPITLMELEDLFLNSAIMRDRLKVHPKIPKTYELSWEGEKILATFDPATFDEYPQSVRLLSFGEDIFKKIIKGVPEPEESSENTGIVRCYIDHLFPCVAFYELRHGEPMVVETLVAFKSSLGRQDLLPWSPADLEAVKSKFLEYIKGLEEKRYEVQSNVLQAVRITWEEQAKRILIKAASIDLAIKLQKGHVLEDFSDNILEHAISTLKNYKFPFAPLLRIIQIKSTEGASGLDYFHKIKNDNINLLQKRFENIRLQAEEVLRKLSLERPSVKQETSMNSPGPIKLKIYPYTE